MTDRKSLFSPISNKNSTEIIYTDDPFKHISAENSVIIVDSNILRLFPETGQFRYIGIDASEKNKTIETVSMIFQRLIEFEAGRSTELIGIGGGITCDIAGFAAAAFKRGMPLELVPTTVLAQADAALGGKNGVNFLGIKNMIGTIRQPSRIIIGRNVRRTLTPELVRDGMVEIIKTAAVCDLPLFEFLEKADARKLSDPVGDVVQQAVENVSCDKLDIVGRDPFEKGERRILNFGHTFGHAFEALLGISHGSAVGLGMKAAVKMSETLFGTTKEISERINSLLQKIGLPERTFPAAESIKKYLIEDKKREDEFIRFVSVGEIGKASTNDVEIGKLYEKYEDMCCNKIK